MTHNIYYIPWHFVRHTLHKLALVATIIAMVFGARVCRAESDLDDNISKYNDDPISGWDELGKKSVNINFIIVDALGKMNLPDKNFKDQITNSVIVGPGSNTGDIYNINLGNGATPAPRPTTSQIKIKDKRHNK